MHNYVKAYIISFYIYTTIQKFGVSKIFFLCFWMKSVMFTKAAFIWSNYSKLYYEIFLQLKIKVFFLNIF